MATARSSHHAQQGHPHAHGREHRDRRHGRNRTRADLHRWFVRRRSLRSGSCTGTNVATASRIFRNNGSDPETAGNNALIGEVAIASTPQAALPRRSRIGSSTRWCWLAAVTRSAFMTLATRRGGGHQDHADQRRRPLMDPRMFLFAGLFPMQPGHYADSSCAAKA